MKSSIFDFAEMQSSAEHSVLTNIARHTHLNTVYPQMLTGHLQGLVLQWISRLIRPLIVVEIGTFTGYSAFCFSLGLAEGGCVHTIERNLELIPFIQENLGDHGLGTTIQLHTGEAEEIIPTLPMPIDLAYIDGDKPQYLSCYQLLLPRLRRGGILMADNVWWGGKVAEPNIKDKDTLGLRRFLEAVKIDSRVEQVFLPIRDGLLMMRVV